MKARILTVYHHGLAEIIYQTVDRMLVLYFADGKYRVEWFDNNDVVILTEE